MKWLRNLKVLAQALFLVGMSVIALTMLSLVAVATIEVAFDYVYRDFRLL